MFRSNWTETCRSSGVSRGGVGVFKPPPLPEIPKFWQSCIWLQIERKISYSNILISLKIAEFRTPTPQDIWEKGSKILKLTGSQLFYISNDK